MPHEPTTLEKRATGCDYKALMAVEDAINHLRAAERALLEEERKHVPHVGIGNQHKLMAYPDIASELLGVRKEIVRRLTCEPNPKAAA